MGIMDFENKDRQQQESVTITPPRERRVIEIPGTTFPHSGYDNALWIHLIPYRLLNVGTGGRAGVYTLGQRGTEFRFLAPLSISTSLNHSYEKYESFHSALLEKIRAFSSGIDQMGTVGGQTYKVATDLITSPGKLTDKGFLTRAASSLSATNVFKEKVDTPLVFTSSQNRVVDLNFSLSDNRGGAIVTDAVKLLEKYSCASLGTGDTAFEFPYIFSVFSEPGSLIKFSYAALTSVQPTYNEPFIDGNSLHVELSLSFEDVSPLFREAIEQGSVVHVVEKSESEIKEYDQQLKDWIINSHG